MEEIPMYNFEKTNWDLLKAKINELLPPITEEPTSPAMVDQLAEKLTGALVEAIEYINPSKKNMPIQQKVVDGRANKGQTGDEQGKE